jgi:hypothetical protein
VDGVLWIERDQVPAKNSDDLSGQMVLPKAAKEFVGPEATYYNQRPGEKGKIEQRFQRRSVPKEE